MTIKQLIDALEEIRRRRGDDYLVQVEVGEWPEDIYPDEDFKLLETEHDQLVICWSNTPDYLLDTTAQDTLQ